MSEPPHKYPPGHNPGVTITDDMVADAIDPLKISSARQLHDMTERKRRELQTIADSEERTFRSITGANITRSQWLEELRESESVAASERQALRNRKYLGSGAFAETLSSVSSVAPTIQQTSIRSLESIFKQFTDTEVAVYAMDDQPIGPRICIADVPEPTLKALASVEVQQRGRRSDRRWHIIAGGLAALVAGVVAWIVRGLLGV